MGGFFGGSKPAVIQQPAPVIEREEPERTRPEPVDPAALENVKKRVKREEARRGRSSFLIPVGNIAGKPGVQT